MVLHIFGTAEGIAEEDGFNPSDLLISGGSELSGLECECSHGACAGFEARWKGVELDGREISARKDLLDAFRDGRRLIGVANGMASDEASRKGTVRVKTVFAQASDGFVRLRPSAFEGEFEVCLD